MLGLAQGLRDGGLDLAAAGQISGTSAGACVAANVATGSLDEAAARQRRESAEIIVPFDLDEFLGLVERAYAEEPDEASALIRIAAMDPIGPSISQDERLGVIAARLPVADWPTSPRLVVNAA